MKRRPAAARAPAPAARRTPAGSPGPAGSAAAGQHERLLGLNQALGNQAMGALLAGQGPDLLSPDIPAPKRVHSGKRVALTVYFGKDRFLLDGRNLQAVESLAEELKPMLDPTLTVDGYASAEGEPAYNKTLSEQRRELVIALLSKGREPRPTFGGSGHGEEQPAVAEAGDGEALEQLRAQNRRVEIVAAPKVFSSFPLPEENKSPLLTSQPSRQGMQSFFTETSKQRVQRRVDEGEFKLSKSKKASFSERAGEKLDAFLDKALQDVGVDNAKRRAWCREHLKAAIKSGVRKLVDKAVDSLDLPSDGKEALKKLIEAGSEVPF